MNDERWVNRRLRMLNPVANWHPDAGAALEQLRRRDRKRRFWQRGGMWSLATLSAGLLVAASLPLPAKCALVGVGCTRPAVLLAPAAAQGSAATSAAKKATTPAPKSSPANFKESGSPNAPLTMELYTDYECPACREFYLLTLPQLKRDFIDTGKLRLVHRDYPLPQHHFAKLATRYANAAGQIGKYDVVGHALFETQPEWSVNGDVEGVLGKVLPAEELAKVKSIVQNDASLDDSMVKDQQMGMFQDHLQQTPTIVIVHKGKRETVAGNPPYSILKEYLEKALTQ